MISGEDETFVLPHRAQKANIVSFGRPESTKYFEMDAIGLGTAYLVAESHFNNERVADSIPQEDVRLSMKIAQLTTRLSRADNAMFAEILGDVVAKTKREENLVQLKGACSKRCCTNWRVDVPSNYDTLRTKFLYGASSIVRNLPHPLPRSDIKDHAYLLIKECFADALAHGLDLEFLQTDKEPMVVLSTSESAACVAIKNRGKLLYWCLCSLLDWSLVSWIGLSSPGLVPVFSP